TASVSGLRAVKGQANYGAAKAGVLTFTLVAAEELAPYGVRVNAICPLANTRLRMRVADSREEPARVSPLVGALSAGRCGITGHVYSIAAGTVRRCIGWTETDPIDPERSEWDVASLVDALGHEPSA